MTKETLPTVSIKGKSYVMVKDRLVFFNETYPNGAIRSEIHAYANGQVIVKALVCPDVKNVERVFTAYSQARENDGMINKTSALENAETSAVGRALAMMGIGVIESVASADEVAKAIAPVEVVKEPLPWEGKEETIEETLERKTADRNPEIDGILAEEEDKTPLNETTCLTCGAPAVFKSGVSKKTGKPWSAYFCSTDDKSHARFV